MKSRSLLPLAIFTLLLGCNASSPDEKLNNSLPDLSLEQILPKVEANPYCTPEMDSELLLGLGIRLIDEDEVLYGAGRTLLASKEIKMARSCLIMAAPRYTTSLCILGKIVGARQNDYDKSEAFNYIAYAARNNESCAEAGLYDIYSVGKLDQPPNKELAMGWLERAARHGDQDAQQDMVRWSSEQDNFPVAYAWARVLNEAKTIEAVQRKMSPQQMAEGEQHYTQLLSQLTPEKDIEQALRKDLIALSSGELYYSHPEVFEDMSPMQRHAFVAQLVDMLDLYPKFHTRGQVVAYALISRLVQSTGSAVDLWQDPALHALLVNDDLSVEDTVAKAKTILAKRKP
ncbi:sel1 repeat family protein [Pseudomonas chlororaphis]|uniref:Lipoprotein n=1 Tax=Pseudomonas chlororaphis TaxID=587753 RepID=A0AAX3G0R3_9PSED|nr:sel1 repeat family protein [Pseudomonas chlororaphis]AZC35428.1 hypothetical protein C4K37_1022 [Pseudomonas chlororaphis subsp. piscium]AZC41969.1 hypothetical protein C4K36_1025 [Pseudomonas chlororaphis subsp. piscium]WDG73922.1 sel1 repeat family protein [Pseudomonas chlororaphis]WDH28441.1 sel1 repeat family protein [Pseudomonas chlororaphis]WDH72443.1 sel1 repeat family protein [Pseudomonas chlororaphis]